MKAILVDYDYDNPEAKTLIDCFHSHEQSLLKENNGVILSFNTVGINGEPCGMIVCKMSYMEAKDLSTRIAYLCVCGN